MKEFLKNWLKLDFIIFAAASLILWFLIIYLTGNQVLEHCPIDQFTKQALAWQKGHNYLPEYQSYLELAQYKGRVYVSFPPCPTFIEFPFTLIFRENTPNSLVMMLFTWLAMLFSFFIFLKLTGNRLLSFFSAFVLFWGTQILYLSFIGRVWHQGQLYGIFFAVTAILIAVYSSKAYMLIFPGLLVGLAVGCRPFYVFLFPFLFYIAWQNKIPFKKALLFLILGIMPIGLFIALYNYVRFQSFFEFGHNYLPHIINDKIRQFGPEFLKKNLFHSFVNLPRFDQTNQIISFSGVGTAFWLTAPIMILPFFFFLKKDIPLRGKIIGILSLLLTWTGLLMHESNGWFQFGYRYGVDLIALMIYFYAVSYKKLTVWMVIVGTVSVIINIYGAFWFYQLPNF
jgi:hypothetical protein